MSLSDVCRTQIGDALDSPVIDTLAGNLNSSPDHTIPGGTIHEPAAPWGEPPEKEGDTLGSYELVKLIGEGSMGRVFLAKHTRLGRQVALKVMRPEHLRNRGLTQRFFQEARSVNQINHEHIVEVFDFVEEVDGAGPGRAYCVMELLVGCSLAELLRREPLHIAQAIRIARQVCKALDAAHEVGVVHRDVKPDNIFITERNGQKDFVKVLDFGVAKLTTQMGEESLQRTIEGMIVGTPPYMAPEQAAGLGAEFKADIYALGVVLYEILSGRPPFESETFGQLVVQVITQPPPPLPAVTRAGERIPSELRALVMRCLEKQPEKRPKSMAELNQALSDIANGRRSRRTLRVRALWTLAAAGLMGSTLGATTLVHPSEANWQAATTQRPAEVEPNRPMEANAVAANMGFRAVQDSAEHIADELQRGPDTGERKGAPPRPQKRVRKRITRDGIINPFEN